MLVTINEIILPLGYNSRHLLKAASGRLRVPAGAIKLEKILRRSLDARNLRRRPSQVVNAVFSVDSELNFNNLKKCEPFTPQPELQIPQVSVSDERPVVIGAGPAGLMAALALARAGAKPLLLERGKPVNERRKDVGAFWGKGVLNPESNVLYGEGGAGTFSDGKLTSRSKDKALKELVLQAFVDAGADSDILFDAYGHIGSDRLAEMIPAIRNRIIKLGGEVRFDSRVDTLHIEDGVLRGVQCADEKIACGICVLACGHSADDVYRMLGACGVELSARDYAVGVRVELPQAKIDRAMLGEFAGNPLLGAASFRLTGGGDCHTFCMCPGGRVITCATLDGTVSTNGMSLSTRGGEYGNAAFLVPLTCGDGSTFAGLEAVEEIERKASVAAGGGFYLPACALPDFLAGTVGGLPEGRSCKRSVAADFSTFLPERVMAVLRESVPLLLRKLPYIDPREAVLYGPETRSTSPVRVVRGVDMQSANTVGLFPAGEGAGYAGGIVSSAIDGAKAAFAALQSCK